VANSPNNGHLSKAVEMRGGNCHLRTKGDNTLPYFSQITALDKCPLLGLFATASEDGYIKVVYYLP
jgi:hypothetical protein